ncbi:MAG: AgmX/PglI C-terminal domain-containing protein [Deltaproteobacteria bacterium]|nr:AgmX/PglI C-terminal domain-containing protein [Deltaproteobacteria bacterium]
MTACREITLLLSQALDRQLSQQERLAVRRHLLTCKSCANYQQQLKAVRALARGYRTAGDAHGGRDLGLSPAAKKSIQQSLLAEQSPEPARPQAAPEPALGASTSAIQTFVFCEGKFVGSELTLGSRIEIGRDPAADVVLQDDMVSRRHAAVTLFRNQLYLEDLRSSNGTLVAGQPIADRVVISQRDDVTIGRHSLKFKYVRGDEASAAALPDDLGEVAATNPMEPGPLQHDPTEVVATGDHVVMTDPESRAPDPEAWLAAAVGDEPEPIHGAPTEIDHPDYQTAARERAASQSRVARDEIGDAGASDLFGGDLARRPPADVDPYGSGPEESRQPREWTAPISAVEEQSSEWTAPISAAEEPPREWTAPISDAAPPPRGWPSDEVELEPELPRPQRFVSSAAADEDDDEDEEQPAGFSLFRLLLTEPGADEHQRGRPALVLIQYRDDAIWEMTTLRRGEAHLLNRDLPPATARELGVPRNFRLARLRLDGTAEIAVAHGTRGKVRQGGATRALDEITDWRGERGVLRLKAGDLATLQLGRDSYLVRFGYPPRHLLQVPPGLISNAEQRREMRRVAFSSTTALGMHFLVLMALYIQSLLLPSPTVQQLAEDRFAEIDTKQLELKAPEPPPQEAPPPKEEPAVEDQAPEPEPKERPQPVRSRTTSPQAKKESPGILAALGKIPKMSGPAGGQTLVAAVSNLDAVKVPGGGGASYKVSGLIGKGPTNRIQLGGSGGGLSTKGLASILREGGGGPGTLSKLKGGAVRGRLVKVSRGSKSRGSGYLDRSEIQKVVNKGIGQIQFCYEKELLKNQSLSGKVVFEWTISRTGRVSIVKTITSSMNSPSAVQCMIGAIKGWVFPAPRGGEVIVTYPFIFNAMGF